VAVREITTLAIRFRTIDGIHLETMKICTLLSIRNILVVDRLSACGMVDRMVAWSCSITRIDVKVFTILDVVLVVFHATSKAILCEAIEMLLIRLVLILQSILNALDKDLSDLFDGILDGLVELSNSAERLFGELLDKGLHGSDIPISDSIQQAGSHGRLRTDCQH